MARRRKGLGGCGCCGGGDPACCGEGTRSIEVWDTNGLGGIGPQSPGCGFGLFGNDGWDMDDGAAGTTVGGVGVVITGTSESLQLGIDYSSDLGDLGEWVLGDPSGGPILIELTAPEGFRICSVVFGASAANFGTNSTWNATVTDTGGTASVTDQDLTTTAFSGSCALAGGSINAYAAAGESITSIEISHDGAPDEYIAIGYMAICLADGAATPKRITETEGARVFEDGVTLRLLEA